MKSYARHLTAVLLAILTTPLVSEASEITYEVSGTSTLPESWGFGDGYHPFVLNVTYVDKEYSTRTRTISAGTYEYLWPHQESGFVGGTLTVNGQTSPAYIGFLQIDDDQPFLNGDNIHFLIVASFNGSANEGFQAGVVVDSETWSIESETATLPKLNFGESEFLRNGFNWNGYSSTTTSITTNGSQPPTADAGPDQTVDCTSVNGSTVTLDGTASSDPDSDPLNYEWSVPASVFLDDPTSPTPTGTFPIGITTATLTVTDGNGGLDVDDVVITVVDQTPPEVSCTTSMAAIWPPKHDMVPVMIYVDATDHCTSPEDLILGWVTIESNEPDDAEGLGDGETTGDVDGQDGFSAPVDVTDLLIYNPETASFEGLVFLRAERDGEGAGRSYSINATVLDSSNNIANTSCVVVVPHDRRKQK